jgi:hypothetical protein
MVIIAVLGDKLIMAKVVKAVMVAMVPQDQLLHLFQVQIQVITAQRVLFQVEEMEVLEVLEVLELERLMLVEQVEQVEQVVELLEMLELVQEQREFGLVNTEMAMTVEMVETVTLVLMALLQLQPYHNLRMGSSLFLVHKQLVDQTAMAVTAVAVVVAELGKVDVVL